ncbi:hypothetical protein GRI44_03990 [Altererythrobacter confluentis]|uniref:Uncharacterized protein n=1 Tax=Allopontixanthobacter confluentis TaxID=1849021 RepID=A0A6L7GE96_9SPHN|nr:hypothetical protein [Allopontixanthobacter confluentis]MXP13910.1 hypothetical protein [Allopontixanthobacter confluentis]
MAALSEQVSTAATPSQAGKSIQSECTARPATSPVKGDPAKACKSRRPAVIYIPTVLFGADRAYE